MKWCMQIKTSPPLEILVEAEGFLEAESAASALYPDHEIVMLYSDGPPSLLQMEGSVVVTAVDGRCFLKAAISTVKEHLRSIGVYAQSWSIGPAPAGFSMGTTRKLSPVELAALETIVVNLWTIPARDWTEGS